MTSKVVAVPDLGGAEEVEVIEVSVAVGDTVTADQTLVVLESDKAMMEIPAPGAGKILKLFVGEGDKIEKEGDPLVEIEVSEAASTADPAELAEDTGAKHNRESVQVDAPAGEASPEVDPQTVATEEETVAPAPVIEAESEPALEPAPTGESTVAAEGAGSARDTRVSADVYAGPAVRQLARELGVNLVEVKGSGPRGRLLKEDVQAHVKRRLTKPAASGSAIPGVPDTDFSQFGTVEQMQRSRIDKLTAANMHRSWLNVPHVTQFDDADISELEAFRKSLNSEGEARGVKMTPVPIILKACAVALTNNPVLNRSLHSDGEHYIQKHYVHIGMAVDTPRGLVVPVLRDVDKKTLWQLAEEVAELAVKARDGKLAPAEMQGGCFTVSSLGAIGGQGFTPIINTPQVAILGVSKAQIKPVWQNEQFIPRTMLPVSLSYDHRAVNGGDAGRFLTELVNLLSDIRRLLL